MGTGTTTGGGLAGHHHAGTGTGVGVGSGTGTGGVGGITGQHGTTSTGGGGGGGASQDDQLIREAEKLEKSGHMQEKIGGMLHMKGMVRLDELVVSFLLRGKLRTD
jgi:hypothetical protein